MSQLVAGMDLSKYQAAYDNDGIWVPPPMLVSCDLARRKNFFAPKVDQSPVLHVYATFEALTDDD